MSINFSGSFKFQPSDFPQMPLALNSRLQERYDMTTYTGSGGMWNYLETANRNDKFVKQVLAEMGIHEDRYAYHRFCEQEDHPFVLADLQYLEEKFDVKR